MTTDRSADQFKQSLDLVIVGAGPAGLAAGAEAARAGAKTVILDEAPEAGGRLKAQRHRRPGGFSDGAAEVDRLVGRAEATGVVIKTGTIAWGLSPENGTGWFVGAAPADPTVGKSPVGFFAKTVILALGAVQLPLVMPGWNLPGVLTAGAAQTMVNRYNLSPGRRVLAVGLDPLGLAAAETMARAGAEVIGPVLPPDNGLQFGPVKPVQAMTELGRLASWAPSALLGAAAKAAAIGPGLAARLYPTRGIDLGGFRPQVKRAAVELTGAGRVNRARLIDLSADGRIKPGREETLAVDAVVASAGLRPLTDLAQVGGCRLVHIPQLGGWTPLHGPNLETDRPGLFLAGSASGVEGAAVAQAQGRLAGLAAARRLGLINETDWVAASAQARREVALARNEALPFSPDIEAGRAGMAALWSDSEAPQG